MDDASQMKHMSTKELRKAVMALRKAGCPPVSRLNKAGLLAELSAYSAANKARAAVKPATMEAKPKGKVATVADKAAEMTMFRNPMLGKKVEKKEAVAKAAAEPAKKSADKIDLEAALYRYLPSGMTARQYKGMEPIDALKMFIKNQQDKKVDKELAQFVLLNYSAPEELKKSTAEIQEELEDFELQIADYNDNPEPAFKSQNDEMVRKVELYKKILAARGVAIAAAPVSVTVARAAPAKAAAATKAKRKPSAYALAVGKFRKQGMTMAEAAAAAKKELGK